MIIIYTDKFKLNLLCQNEVINSDLNISAGLYNNFFAINKH